MFTALGLPPSLASQVHLCSCCPSLDLPTPTSLQCVHLMSRTCLLTSSKELPPHIAPCGNFHQHFADPKPYLVLVVFTSPLTFPQMDYKLLEDKHI